MTHFFGLAWIRPLHKPWDHRSRDLRPFPRLQAAGTPDVLIHMYFGVELGLARAVV
jgi:hypothetical protein